jgi:hypothetical protein
LKNVLNSVLNVKVLTNDKKDKVEQKQSRLIKKTLISEFTKQLLDSGITIKYDVKDNPVMLLDNGLIIGFDFTVKKLDTELYDEKS